MMNAEEYVPQTSWDRRPLVMWSLVATGALSIIAAILAAPLAIVTGHNFAGSTIYQVFSHVCHQLPERSFFIAGHKLAVCARCAGVYTGFAGVALVYPLLRPLRRTTVPHRRWLFLSALPLAIDFTLGFLGIWENTHLSRFATGALVGAVSVPYVIPGLVEISLGRWPLLFQSVNAAMPSLNPSEVVLTHSGSAAPSDYSAPHRRI